DGQAINRPILMKMVAQNRETQYDPFPSTRWGGAASWAWFLQSPPEQVTPRASSPQQPPRWPVPQPAAHQWHSHYRARAGRPPPTKPASWGARYRRSLRAAAAYRAPEHG